MSTKTIFLTSSAFGFPLRTLRLVFPKEEEMLDHLKTTPYQTTVMWPSRYLTRKRTHFITCNAVINDIIDNRDNAQVQSILT